MSTLEDTMEKLSPIVGKLQQLLERSIHNEAPFEDMHQFLPLKDPLDNPYFVQGSSTNAIPSQEVFFHTKTVPVPKQVMPLEHNSIRNPGFHAESSKSKQLHYSKQDTNFVSDCGDRKDGEDYKNAVKTLEGDVKRSKNLIVERKRRQKLSNMLLTLRSLVPRITKMDRMTILVDAASYIGELQKKVQDLHDELRELEEEEANDSAEFDEQRNTHKRKLEDHETGLLSPSDISTEQSSKHNQDFSSVDDLTQQMEVKVEVSPGGGNKFFLEIICKRKRGGFTRLMEAMDAFGIQVLNANVATLKGEVWHFFTIEAPNDVQLQEVHGSLLKLIQNQQLMD